MDIAKTGKICTTDLWSVLCPRNVLVDTLKICS